MSIFSRLRKRDSDEAAPPEAASSGKNSPPPTVSPLPPPTAKGGAPASAKAAAAPLPPPLRNAEETNKTAAHDETKAPPSRPAKGSAGMTRAYHAVGPSAVPAPRHPVPVSTGAATTKGPPARPPAPTITNAILSPSELDTGGARGAVSRNGTAAPKATNVANGVLGGSRNAASPVADSGAPREPAPEIGSIDQAFEALFPIGHVGDGIAFADGTSTAADRKAAFATFEELAVAHAAPIRSLMLEVRWGEAQTSWIALARPALLSLRAMSGQLEHAALVAAVDGFDAALGELLRPGVPPAVTGAARDGLLEAYGPLLAALPAAFELEGERNRREPVIVRALLEQVPGLDPLMMDRMVAAGLGRLETLYAAKAEEIAAVAGVPREVGAAAAECVRAFRQATPAPLAALDWTAAADELRALVEELASSHRAFEAAARGWSASDRETKRRTRRGRDVGFAKVTIVLARLGEVDFALYLQKLPFQRRLDELEGLLGRLTAVAAPALAGEAAPPSYDEIEIEKRIESGAHAAP